MSVFFREKFFLALFIVILSSCSGRYLLHSSYSKSPVPPAPDYSDEKNWAAIPWKKDPSDSIAGGQVRKSDSMLVDVFFVHPTTFTRKPKNDYRWNADVNDENLNQKTDRTTILYQASVFNQSCNVYAPRYRQAQISAFHPKRRPEGIEALTLAYSDVRNAFQYYLDHYNQGKPFIIASHSQGTVHATWLLREFLQDSALRERMIAAYLVGFPVNADSLKFMKPCESANDINCYCTWNTFARDYFPPYYEEGLNHSVCTNPLSWTTDTLFSADTLHLGGVLLDYQELAPQLCDAQVHDGLLWVSKPDLKLPSFYPIKIYHIADINLFYYNMQQNIADRIDSYFHERKQAGY